MLSWQERRCLTSMSGGKHTIPSHGSFKRLPPSLSDPPSTLHEPLLVPESLSGSLKFAAWRTLFQDQTTSWLWGLCFAPVQADFGRNNQLLCHVGVFCMKMMKLLAWHCNRCSFFSIKHGNVAAFLLNLVHDRHFNSTAFYCNSIPKWHH